MERNCSFFCRPECALQSVPVVFVGRGETKMFPQPLLSSPSVTFNGFKNYSQLFIRPHITGGYLHPSLGLSKPNKCFSPPGLCCVEPANRTGPFKTARKTPSGSMAIQKCDTTKEKAGHVWQRRGGGTI